VDLDAAVLWYATRGSDNFKKVKEIGIDDALLVGNGKAAWAFVRDFHDKYGEFPGLGVIAENAGLQVKPIEENINLAFLFDELSKRSKFNTLQAGLRQSITALDRGELELSESEVFKLLDRIKQERGRHLKIHTMAEVAPEVETLYRDTKDGKIGIPFPWPAMTAMTMGMWPGTLTFFVARPGVGKSWTAIFCTWHAWSLGYKVLIVSPEMNRLELAERFVTYHGRFSFGDVVSGKLGDFVEPKFFHCIGEVAKVAGNYYILDDEDRLEPHYIEDAIEAIDPDLVAIDSVYMLRAEQGKIKSGPGSRGGRYDRILETIDWTRSTARRTHKPFIGVSQLNKDAPKLKGKTREKVKKGLTTGGMENALAMSDTLLWDSHNLFGMLQDDDMRLNHQMMYLPLKVRRQVKVSAIVTAWNMETMDFQEIGTKVDDGDFTDRPSMTTSNSEVFDERLP